MRRTLLFRRPRSRGQSLVEFAFVLPIFLLMLFGLVDIGRFVYLNSTLSQAAREGARRGAVEASFVADTYAYCNQPGGAVCPSNVTALRADVLAAANEMMTPFGSIVDADLHVSCDTTTPPSGTWTSPTKNCNTAAAREPGAIISVRVEMEIQPITPIIGNLFSSIELSGAASMDIN